MADDRSGTGSAGAEDDVHDDDELAEVLAAELERYATGAVPVVPRPAAAPARPVGALPAEPATSLAPAAPAPAARPLAAAAPAAVSAPVSVDTAPLARDETAFARRAAEVEQAMRRTARPTPPLGDDAEPFRRAERPTGRRSTTGPIVQPAALPTADDLPVKRRTGFRPPPSAIDVPPIEPIDRVLPTGPVTLPEATASLLDAMIEEATGPIDVVQEHPHSRHAAPLAQSLPDPEQERRPDPEPQPVPGVTTGPMPVEPRPASPAPSAPGIFDDWEQSLRAIGRPRPSWDQDDVLVPTGGDANLPTVAIPVLRTGPFPSSPLPIVQDADPAVQEARPVRRRAHALPVEPVVEERAVEAPAEQPLTDESGPPEAVEPLNQRHRSGRRRAAVTRTRDVPVVTTPVRSVPLPSDADFVESAAFEIVDEPAEPLGTVKEWRDRDRDDDGIDEFAVDYPVVSAATTGAIDLPQVEPRPRTAPVLIERVRTAILQLPSVPSSPTGSGAAAIVGRWLGAFASPLTLVLAFGLGTAGGGAAAAVAVLAGALLAVPSVARTALWSARTTDDAAMHETAVLGAAAGRPVAVALLLARLGAAATVLLLVGGTAGAWADRTGALGLGSSTAALLGCVVAALLAILCAALPVRASAVLTLLAAVVGAIGTLLIALVLAPNGGPAIATTASGAVAGAVAGFVGVGLLLVLCGADVARWRTDIAHPVSTAVGAAAAVLSGGVLLAAGTVIAARFGGDGDALDGFAGALSDSSASALAAPMLVVLLASAVTLPALLLRSSGAAAARLLGAGRPVRLGAVATGLLALAGALGLLATGVDPSAAAVAAAGILGVPVAAWAGLVLVTPAARRAVPVAVALGVGTLLGWALSDGLVPGTASPVLTVLALPASTGLRGGPALGIAVALVVGAVAGVVGGMRRTADARPVPGPADTVEG